MFFNFGEMSDDELRDVRAATISQAATKLEMLAGVIMTAVRHQTDREIARRRDQADAAAKRPKEIQHGERQKTGAG